MTAKVSIVRSIVSNWSIQKTVVVCVLAAILLLGAIGFSMLDKVAPAVVPAPMSGMSIQTMQGQFIDVDNDGRIDFVVNASVIVNPGSINFIQPTQPSK